MADTIYKSVINIDVALDENRVPEKLSWTARDGGVIDQETKAIMLSVWDSSRRKACV
jgi:hypothetical protein